jgi:hypothetical protein
MENYLKNSIYLKDGTINNSLDEPFSKTEEIMKEDSSAAINDSTKKSSRKYHLFEKTMISSFDNGH